MCSTSGSDYVTMQGKRPEVCAWLCLYHLVFTSLKIYWYYIDSLCKPQLSKWFSSILTESQNRILNLHYLFVIFTRFSRIWILIRSESDSKWWSDLFWFWSDQKSHSLFSCHVSSSLHCLSSAQQVLWSHHCPAEKAICCLCLNDLWRSLQVGLGGFHISDKTLRWALNVTPQVFMGVVFWVGVGE